MFRVFPCDSVANCRAAQTIPFKEGPLRRRGSVVVAVSLRQVFIAEVRGEQLDQAAALAVSPRRGYKVNPETSGRRCAALQACT